MKIINFNIKSFYGFTEKNKGNADGNAAAGNAPKVARDQQTQNPPSGPSGAAQSQARNPNQGQKNQQSKAMNDGNQQKGHSNPQQQHQQQQTQARSSANSQITPSVPPGFATGSGNTLPSAFSRQVQVQAPAPTAWGQPQPSAWGQQPPQSVWGPKPQQQTQRAASQQQPQPSQATQGRPMGQENPQRENKGQQQRPATVPMAATPSQSSAQQQQVRPKTADSATGAIAKQLQQTQMSPIKTLRMIESNPDGRVYEGSRGQRCTLEVNYLKISVKNLIPTAFHYDVEFVPDIPKKMLSRALEVFMGAHFSSIQYAFDGRKNFYTNKLLEVKGVILDGEFAQDVTAVLGDRSKEFKVKVKFATEVDMSVLRDYQNPQMQYNDKPSQAIQCLDVILRTVFKSMTADNRAVAVGRALYFAARGNPLDLGEGMELWLGLFQSAVLGRKSLYLNVDVAHKAFPSAIRVLDVLASFDRDRRIPSRLSEWQEKQLNEYLKMLSIGYRTNPSEPYKTFGYNGLKQSARDALFVDSDGTKMSVLQYFERKKGIKLNYPELPCLWVGSKVRNVYLPLELCIIPAGQATNKKCTPNCVAQMIKYSATSTDERKRKIFDLLNRINYEQPNGEIRGFGIDVDKNFQRVDGRVIDPPQVKYMDGNVRPRNGVWNGKKFLETQQGNPIKWAVVNCDDRTTIQQVMELKKNILSESRRLGMNLAESSGNNDYFSFNMMRARPNDLTDLLDKCSKTGYGIVFVIIIDKNDCYAKVKQAAELKVGILTQCIKANTIFRMGRGNPMMTINNILLKVNAKLNGKNQEIVESSYQSFNAANSGVMFVGADVTHPSPDQRDIPSVVGVAASYDQVGFRYQCAWRLQDPKKEIIEDLANILTDQLIFYKLKNKTLPKKIMYYRDGVSDGQFPQVSSTKPL